MTSLRKMEANRRNAARSTGPRSVLGKARTRFNALKHGLAVGTLHHAATSPEIERLAAAIAGEAASPVQLQNAHNAAAAQLELNRIQQLRASIIKIEQLRGEGRPPEVISNTPSGRRAAGMVRALPHLKVFERYQQRALSRRNKLFRAC